MAILDKYYKGEVVVHDESYKFSDSGIYYSPAVASYEKLMHYLDMLPPMDNPEVR
jgi:dynein heavy chain, axonemal